MVAASTNSTSASRASKNRTGTKLRHVFLTGYPGFIGKSLAKRILIDRPRAKLTILVQEKFRSDAEAYVRELPDSQEKRVRILSGDVAKMDLGLSGPEIDELSEGVTHVYHLAALQYFGVSDEEAERVNVGGTRNMVMLAKEFTALKRFVHFSTCYVSGDRIGVITEDDLDEGQSFRNHYERTKFEAEKALQAAADQVPLTILRPSIVVGDSETGEIDRLDGIYNMGLLVVTSPVSVPLPLPGDGVAPLNVVPVDFVVKAAIALAEDESANGKTFHLVDPNPLSSRKAYELIAARAGKELSKVNINYGVARRLLRVPVLSRFAKSQAQAVDYLNHLAIYNSTNTLAHLEGTGILCPPFSTYVERLMDYVSEQRRALRPEGKKQKSKKGRKRGPLRKADPFDS
ncbi:MAG: SDR family oxidoreductase [Deltaproteobacteria bacterium]|nr:SDR family oxidoreductase [Deltaproteobacteria bacterium]